MNRRFVMLLLSAGLAAPGIQAASRSSRDYQLLVEANGQAGGQATSTAYRLHGAMGGPAAPLTAPQGVKVLLGYPAQLVELVELELGAFTLTPAEHTTNQLVALNARAHDGTEFAPAPGALQWTAPPGSGSSVDSNGVFRAGAVYTSTNLVIRGAFLGKAAELTLTVLDADPDDYRRYGQDGIPDAWQVGYFGPDTDAGLAGADPDGDGQPNLFEYLAGTLPGSPASRLTLELAPDPAGTSVWWLTLAPRRMDRVYSVQYRDDLTSGSYQPLNPGEVLDTDTSQSLSDTNAPGWKRFYRVGIRLAQP